MGTMEEASKLTLMLPVSASESKSLISAMALDLPSHSRKARRTSSAGTWRRRVRSEAPGLIWEMILAMRTGGELAATRRT